MGSVRLRSAGVMAASFVLAAVSAAQQPAAEPTFPAVLFTATGEYPHEVGCYAD